MKTMLLLAGALIVAGAAIGGGRYLAYPVQVSTWAGLTRNYFISWAAPLGTATTEPNAAYKSVVAVAPSAAVASETAADWPSYNRTVTSDRPHLIPYAVTVADAAAPDVSLRFFFYAGVVVLPLIVAYTIGVYWVFRGKIGRLNT